MEWNMLKESKKLFPHWLDKSENSNFSKHLKILNKQQLDIRHKLKTVEWSKLLNKPLQIHKVQTEPHKWKIEFEANIKRLKQVNIYKNPVIVDNVIINDSDVTEGYYYDGIFYKNHDKKITNLKNSEISEEDNSYQESEINVSDNYYDEINVKENGHYYDLISKKYYKFINNNFEEESEEDALDTSLIYSQSYIDNYSHFFRYVLYEDNTNEVSIEKYVVDEDNNIIYKTIINSNDVDNNGKYELNIVSDENIQLYFNKTTGKYCILKGDSFVEIDDNKIVWVDIDNEPFENEEGYYYLTLQSNENLITSKIPIIESEDITPIISNDKYVLEVYTWDDYHFLKGFPEIDFIDYNNNNIIDNNEKNYDNLDIKIEKINDIDYLTFRVHQFGIKLVEIFKDDKPIHVVDFVVEKLGYSNKSLNSNFAHIYNYNDNTLYYPFRKDTDSLEEINLDVDKYVWRLKLNDDDKLFDSEGNWNYKLKNKYDIKVTYYDSSHPTNPEYDKILMKTYVFEDSIFYHDISLDMIGNLFNVHRYVFRQPPLETYKDQLKFYSKTYPTYCNSLSEDDYHYQKRLTYYINNYNKIYFPCLELWKYFHIDSELVNRMVIIAEQNYSYMRTLNADEYKYINELGTNKLESFYLNDEYTCEEEEQNLQKPKIKSIISPDDYLNSRNGILVDDNNNYIKDINGTPIKTSYVYNIVQNEETGDKEYVIEYQNASRTFQWYFSEEKNSIYRIKLTNLLKVVPNTKYQLRFCVKEYPESDLNLKLIYKNKNGDIRDVIETTPLRQDYDELNEYEEYNELVYTDYQKEWGISCEYICTDFLTLDNAINLEIVLESESAFKISDATLQRITINHFDSEYMKTTTDYNSCVYDLYADYTKIPSNIRYDDLSIFNKVLNRSLPLTKIGYFNFIMEDTNINNNMKLDTKVNIYLNNLLETESSSLSPQDNAVINTKTHGVYEHIYRFNKYIKKGEYTISFKPFYKNENNIINDFKIDIIMIVFNDNNTANEKTLTIDNFDEYLVTDTNGKYYKIPFENKSDNSFKIRIYRNKKFEFKDFKLTRKLPLGIGEITDEYNW